MDINKYKELRQMIVEALKRDLIGPDHNEQDILNEPPTQSYLTGILHPLDKEEIEDGEELSDPIINEEEANDNDNSIVVEVVEKNIQGRSKKLKKQSTMGIRFYTKQDDANFNVLIRWGKYEKKEEIREGRKKLLYVRNTDKQEISFSYSMLDNGKKEFLVTQNLNLVIICREVKNTNNLLFSVFLKNTSVN
ncbi:DNA helicase, partial [Anoxybacillus sp. J5B_2022]|nr:DNA helicase [Anoxybacillus sp. J5B_2022]